MHQSPQETSSALIPKLVTRAKSLLWHLDLLMLVAFQIAYPQRPQRNHLLTIVEVLAKEEEHPGAARPIDGPSDPLPRPAQSGHDLLGCATRAVMFF